MKDTRRLFNMVCILCLLLAGSSIAGGVAANPLSPEAPASLGPPLTAQLKEGNAEAGAEVLHHITETFVQSDYHRTAKNYVSVKILDKEAARDYGRLTIGFNHHYYDLKLDFARVVSRAGTVSSVKPDAVQLRVTGGGQDFYSDDSEVVFSLPDIAPGSVIEFQYTLNSERLAMPQLFSDVSVPYWFQQTVDGQNWRADPVANYRYSLTLADGLPFHHRGYQNYPKKFKQRRTEAGLTRTWQLKSVPRLASERETPQLRELAPMMRVGTQTDWAVIAQWSWDLVKDKIQATDELREITSKLNLAPNANRDQKIRAVYAYLQNNVRYVFAHLGRGGYEPHPAESVKNAGYGDCKDQTVLAISLLKALGVQAHPVLVQTPRSGDSDTALPSLIFDHMMVYIPAVEDAPAIWLDTTGDTALYPGVSNYLEGQNALIVDGKAGVLTKMTEGFSDNHAELHIRYRPAEQGRTLVDVDVIVSGVFEQYLRSWWIHSATKEDHLDKYVKTIFGNSTDYTVQSEFLNADSLWEPVRIKAQYRFDANPDTDVPTYAAGFIQAYRQFGAFDSMQLPETRVHRFVDPLAYTIALTADMYVTDGQIPTLLESSGLIEGQFTKLEQKGLKQENRYRYEARLKKPALDLSVKAYKHHYETLKRIAHADPWVVSMRDDKTKQQLSEVDRLTKTPAQVGVNELIKIVRTFIDQGDYEQALKTAERAVAQGDQNGEAWYLLAMSQGLNNQIDASSRSFDRAADLGYLP